MRGPLYTQSVTAENQWTEWARVEKGSTAGLGISGAFSATVTLQHRLDGATAEDVETWDAPAQELYEAPADVDIRLGVKEGDFSSGPVSLLVAL